jgi:SdpC family antimicrobial peptide
MVFVSLTTFGVGCGSPADKSTNVSYVARHQALSGQDFYKGMVFGVGPAAHFFDELWQRPEIKSQLEGADLLEKRETAADRLVAKIAELDATFFDRFARDLRSGEHLTIDRLLTETKEKTYAATVAIRREVGLSDDVNSSAAQKLQGTWFYTETVVAVAVAGVLYFIVTQIDVTPVMDPSQTSALRRDIWVDMLAAKSFDIE